MLLRLLVPLLIFSLNNKYIYSLSWAKHNYICLPNVIFFMSNGISDQQKCPDSRTTLDAMIQTPCCFLKVSRMSMCHLGEGSRTQARICFLKDPWTTVTLSSWFQDRPAINQTGTTSTFTEFWGTTVEGFGFDSQTGRSVLQSKNLQVR